MFPRLTDDPKFKKDLKKFQYVRDNLPTELSKNTMSSILEDFISCAKNVDTHHTPYPDGTIRSSWSWS